jgi:DNA-binding PadR family transcriptional regulator
LQEWIVLAVIAEAPTHGFSVARLLQPGSDLGRTYRVPHPAVYRSVDRLLAAGLVEAAGTEQSRKGPRRTLLQATPAGASAAADWLERPVPHVRDMRTELMVKLALLHRRSADHSGLVRAQHDLLTPIVEALAEKHRAAAGFDRVLAAWRLESGRAALRFLDGLLR